MRNFLRGLPPALWIFPVMVVTLMMVLALAVVFQQDTPVTLTEPIVVEFTDPGIILAPNEVQTRTVTITNLGPAAVDVILTADVIDPLTGPVTGVAVTGDVNTAFTVPPLMSLGFEVTLTSGNGTPAGPAIFTISVIRP